jgi:hypothetical protein
VYHAADSCKIWAQGGDINQYCYSSAVFLTLSSIRYVYCLVYCHCVALHWHLGLMWIVNWFSSYFWSDFESALLWGATLVHARLDKVNWCTAALSLLLLLCHILIAIFWKSIYRFLGFEVMAVTIKSTVLWMVTPCSLERADTLEEHIVSIFRVKE